MEDLPLWLKLARQQGGPVLELGCGTGRVLIPLAQAGCFVVGLDHDPEMLRFLQTQLPPNLEPQPQMVKADLTSFDLGKQFPLIILPCNTWSTLEPERRCAALACITRHLTPDGLFAVSVPAPDLLRNLPAFSSLELEEEFEDPLSGGLVQVSSGWRRAKDHLTVTWQYDVLWPDGRTGRFSLKTQHTLSTLQEYLEELDEAGLSVEAIYGDHDGTPYSAESDSLIIISGQLLANL